MHFTGNLFKSSTIYLRLKKVKRRKLKKRENEKEKKKN